jgi:hypothetical protein
MSNPLSKLEHIVANEPEHQHEPRYSPTNGSPARESDGTEPMHDELAHSTAAPGMPVATSGSMKGLVFGSVLGGAIGFVLLTPLGFIPLAGMDLIWRLTLFAVVGMLAGGTAGAVYEGARIPMLEGEATEDDGVVLGLQGEQSGTPLRHEISTDEPVDPSGRRHSG